MFGSHLDQSTKPFLPSINAKLHLSDRFHAEKRRIFICCLSAVRTGQTDDRDEAGEQQQRDLWRNQGAFDRNESTLGKSIMALDQRSAD